MARRPDTLGWIGLMAAFAMIANGKDERAAIRAGRKLKATFGKVERTDPTSRKVVRMLAAAMRKQPAQRKAVGR